MAYLTMYIFLVPPSREGGDGGMGGWGDGGMDGGH